MEEGLLFDRIDVEGADLSVDQGVVGAADILPDPTEAALLVAEPAKPRAEAALDLAVGQLDVMPGLDVREVRARARRRQPAAEAGEAGPESQARARGVPEEASPVHSNVSSTVSIAAASARPSPIFSAVAR